MKRVFCCFPSKIKNWLLLLKKGSTVLKTYILKSEERKRKAINGKENGRPLCPKYFTVHDSPFPTLTQTGKRKAIVFPFMLKIPSLPTNG